MLNKFLIRWWLSVQLAKFFRDRKRAEWMYSKYGKFYIRRGYHGIEFGKAPGWFLTLASVEIYKEYQRRGLFKAALRTLHRSAVREGMYGVYVENVRNPHMRSFLISRGYQLSDFDPASMYWKAPRND